MSWDPPPRAYTSTQVAWLLMNTDGSRPECGVPVSLHATAEAAKLAVSPPATWEPSLGRAAFLGEGTDERGKFRRSFAIYRMMIGS